MTWWPGSAEPYSHLQTARGPCSASAAPSASPSLLTQSPPLLALTLILTPSLSPQLLNASPPQAHLETAEHRRRRDSRSPSAAAFPHLETAKRWHQTAQRRHRRVPIGPRSPSRGHRRVPSAPRHRRVLSSAPRHRRVPSAPRHRRVSSAPRHRRVSSCPRSPQRRHRRVSSNGARSPSYTGRYLQTPSRPPLPLLPPSSRPRSSSHPICRDSTPPCAPGDRHARQPLRWLDGREQRRRDR